MRALVDEGPDREMATPVPPSGRRRGVRPDALLALVAGLGAVVVVGREGSPGWQIARVVAVAALAVAGLVLHRRAGLAAAGGEVVLGIVATAAGLGIGGRHLVGVAPWTPTIAGFAVLVGGVGLLGSGSVRLVRATPRWWRWGTVLAIAVAVLLVGSVTTIAVAATNVPPTEVGDRTPADLGLAFDEVAVPTDDGVVLAGWYLPSRNGAAVVALHGAGSTRSSVLDQAAVLARAGYGVLLLDARGHGRSGGVAMDLGWWGDADTRAAVDWLVEQPDVDAARIGVVGLSMGGEEAIGAAASDDRIAAVVAEGVTGRVAADDAWLSEQYGWRGAVQERVERLQQAVTEVLTSAEPPIALRDAVVAAAPTPVLVVAGGAVADEVHVARRLHAAAPDSVSTWVVPRSGHTQGLDTDPERWEQRVVGFLDDALAPSD